MLRPHRVPHLAHTPALPFAILLALAPPAHANDSSALLEAGGIVFTVSNP